MPGLVSLLPSGGLFNIGAGSFANNLPSFTGFNGGAGKSTAQTSAGSGAGRIESVPAILVPFDMGGLSGPLEAIRETGGLVFQYSPSITETISVQYTSSGDIVHSNEQYQVFKSTDNRKINLGAVTFTADTEENARYMLAAIHFLRVYSLMDFGKGKSGRPPSPMWFSAYGKLAFDRVPVLFSGATISWPKDVDYVRVSLSTYGGSNRGGRNATATIRGSEETRTSGYADPPPFDSEIPGVSAIRRRPGSVPSTVQPVQATPSTNPSSTGVGRASELLGLFERSSGASGTSGDYAWVPTKMETEIQLTVQHSPAYWKNSFSLDDFYSGGMVEGRETSVPSDQGGTAAPRTGSGSGPEGSRPAAIQPTARPAGVPATRQSPQQPNNGLSRTAKSFNQRNSVASVDPVERLKQLRNATGSFPGGQGG